MIVPIDGVEETFKGFAVKMKEDGPKSMFETALRQITLSCVTNTQGTNFGPS